MGFFFKLAVNFVDFARIRESSVVFAQDFQAFAHLAFSHDADDQGFVAVGVAALGVQGGDAAAELGHKLLRDFVGIGGYNFELITAAKTLQHKINDQVRNENIAKGGKHGVDARMINEQGEHDDGRVQDEGKPSKVCCGEHLFDERGDGVGAARRAETAQHKRIAEPRNHAHAKRCVNDVVAFLIKGIGRERRIVR